MVKKIKWQGQANQELSIEVTLAIDGQNCSSPTIVNPTDIALISLDMSGSL